MPKLWNLRRRPNVPKGSVYIGRPGKWGNPFVMGRDGTREEVIFKFEKRLRSKPDMMRVVKKELRGKDLVCFCAPLPCHGDVLLKIANEERGASNGRG